jgi:hypothetical protein
MAGASLKLKLKLKLKVETQQQLTNHPLDLVPGTDNEEEDLLIFVIACRQRFRRGWLSNSPHYSCDRASSTRTTTHREKGAQIIGGFVPFRLTQSGPRCHRHPSLPQCRCRLIVHCLPSLTAR